MIKEIKVKIPGCFGKVFEVEGIDEALQGMNRVFSTLTRQNSTADAAEKGEQRLGRVTGSPKRTHAKVIMTFR